MTPGSRLLTISQRHSTKRSFAMPSPDMRGLRNRVIVLRPSPDICGTVLNIVVTQRRENG